MRYPHYSPELNKLLEQTSCNKVTAASSHSSVINKLIYAPESNKGYTIKGDIHYNEERNFFALKGSPFLQEVHKNLKVNEIKEIFVTERTERRQLVNSKGEPVIINRNIFAKFPNEPIHFGCTILCPELDALENTLAELPINCVRPDVELFPPLATIENVNEYSKTCIEISTHGHFVGRQNDQTENRTLTVCISCELRDLRGMHIPFTIQTTHEYLAELNSP